MTRVFLEPDETFHVLSSNTDIRVFGGAGRETVRLCDYPTGTELDGNIEVVQVTGPASDTTLQINAQGQLELAHGGEAYATFTGGLNAAVDLQFEDGNVTLTQIGASRYTITAPKIPNNVRTIDESTSYTADAVSLGPYKVMTRFGWVEENTYISGSKASDYNIKFVVYSAPDPALLDGIANAAERITGLMTKGAFDYTEDIFVNVYFMDLQSIWGSGSANTLRTEHFIPTEGTMKLDKDASQSIGADRFEGLVFHEFLHTMGFGVLWDGMGLIDDYNGDLRFNGPSATAYYNSEFPSIAASDPNSHLGVPVETDGAEGTAGKHWDESTFGDEVMTSYLGGSNHVSDMTIAALADMGYDVML